MITLVLARAENGVIGRDGKLPWHLPADLKRFKALTTGKPMVMGRKTFESFPAPLPGRRHIVLTRQRGWSAKGAEVAHSLDEALALAGPGDIAVIGGADIFELFMPLATRLEITEIFENTGGSGQTGTTYKLDIVIKESLTNELVKISGDAKSQVYELDATFKLISNDGRVVLEGKATSRAAYERYETVFSNVRARQDAENRAARTVAESIKVRIAAYLSQAA